MDVIQNYFSPVNTYIESLCKGQPSWKIIAISSTTTIIVLWSREFLFQDIGISARCKATLFSLARKIPYVRNKILMEIEKVSSGMAKEMNDNINNDSYILELPCKGWSDEEILKEVEKYSKYGSFDWTSGCASGTVYNGDEALTKLMSQVYALSLWTNPLHTDVFPGIRKMEAECVRMCCNMFNGGPNSCGTMTTGGTESIIMACKAYRTYAMKVKGIKNPEMIVPITAHAAFDKGAELLGISIKHVPVNPHTMKVDVKAMESMISKRTCMIVGSAPQFAHGVIDPISDLSDLALKYNIPLHVDACLGGFLIAFMEEAGYSLTPFDFRVQGVTSISCDTHKYGYSPKGSSVILYKNKEWRQHQFFVQAEWPGGIYATPTLSGSRPGGIIAATWAAMIYHGRDGYVKFTKDIISTAKEIERGCRMIPGITVMGRPEVSVVSFTSDIFNIYILSDRMTQKGWNLNALQYPTCMHIAVTVLHTKAGVAKRLIDDISEIADDLIKNPPKEIGGSAALYGMAQSLPDRSILDEIAAAYIDATLSTQKTKDSTSS